MNVHTLTFLFSIAASLLTVFAALRCIHMLQLESYQPNMYRKWVARAGRTDALSGLLLGFAAFFLRIGYMFVHSVSVELSAVLWYGCDILYLLGLLYIGFSNRKSTDKKPLVFTGRVKRLMVAIVVFSFILYMNLGIFMKPGYESIGQIALISFLRYLPAMILPYTVLAGHYSTLPVETAVKQYYLNDAIRKIRNNPNMLKIAITGSYGKTSTKYMLGTILQEKYKTFFTPGSFNTPMGITRAVREGLQADHEVFIAEMGARYAGDIDELCKMVEPEIGVITSVGKQHLETFGSFDAVIQTKSELLRSLPQDGAAFINGDIPECREMFDACTVHNKYFFGLTGENLYMHAVDIAINFDGSTFTLVAEDGEQVRCTTVLLGKHNIGNITAAAAVAKYAGLTMQEIASGIEKIKPVEHRLQLIKGPVTVIDDAYNANPVGTKAALEVLAAFAPANRVIVTPGMVELGAEEETFHEQLGRDIAAAANIAILVGKQRVEPIKRGLMEAGFAEANIMQVASLTEVTELLPTCAPAGSVVLFENDLPDNYTE